MPYTENGLPEFQGKVLFTGASNQTEINLARTLFLKVSVHSTSSRLSLPSLRNNIEISKKHYLMPDFHKNMILII